MAEKNQKPTPQKIREGREKGQVGKSQDFLKIFILVLTCEIFFLLVDFGVVQLLSVINIDYDGGPKNFMDQVFFSLSRAQDVLIAFTLISFIVAFFACILGNWLQFGPVFAKKVLHLKFDGMNPAGNFKQQFSKKNFIQFSGNILKLIIVILSVSYFIFDWLGTIRAFFQVNIDNVWLLMFDLFKQVVRVTYAVFLVFASADILIQKFLHLKQISMSMDELRREFKQNEGDPMMKGYRKQIALEQNAQPPERESGLENSDMLLVNPTHYAVGLRYKVGETPLPVVMVRAQGLEAKLMAEKAVKLNIPVVKNILLTRSIFYETELGGYIKRDVLKDVAYLYVNVVTKNVPKNAPKGNVYKI